MEVRAQLVCLVVACWSRELVKLPIAECLRPGPDTSAHLCGHEPHPLNSASRSNSNVLKCRIDSIVADLTSWTMDRSSGRPSGGGGLRTSSPCLIHA
jgi:hypothetical protein